MKQNKFTFSAVLSAIVCLCFLAVFCVINFRGFARFCTPDMYSDTLLSRIIWESGSIFPENWIFGNQFYVAATPVLAALMYGLCGSVNLAMVLATTVMTALTLLSFWWMVRPYADTPRILLGMAVLLGCVFGPDIVTTIEGQIFYLMASYYAGYLITMFVVYGDYTHTLTGRKSGVSLALAVFLSFCTGMQSLRQTAVMVLPLLGFECLRLLYLRFVRKHPESWNWAATIRAGLYALANLAGQVAIKLLDPNCVTMYEDLSFNAPGDLAVRFSTSLRALRSVTGLKYLTGETLLLGLTALVLVLAAVAGLLSLLRRRDRLQGDEILMLLLLCSILCIVCVNMVVNIYIRSIYIFPWYALAAVAALVLAGKLRKAWQTVLTLALSAVLLCNLALSYGPTAANALSDKEPPERQVAQYLMDEGYAFVYGPWVQVSGIAVWTDGQVAAGSWHENICQVIPYITPTDIFSQEDNARACYLTTGAGVEQSLQEYAAAQGASLTLVKRFEGTAYALYTCDRQLMYFE